MSLRQGAVCIVAVLEVLKGNEAAVQLYVSEGFKQVHSQFDEDHKDDVLLMELNLCEY